MLMTLTKKQSNYMEVHGLFLKLFVYTYFFIWVKPERLKIKIPLQILHLQIQKIEEHQGKNRLK